MRPNLASRMVLADYIQNFDPTKVKTSEENIKYLEGTIEALEERVIACRSSSMNPKNPARLRARSRDLEQNIMGLINGIKFSISFMVHKDQNIQQLNADAIEEEKKEIKH